MSYFKHNIDGLEGYIPGSQPDGDVIKLNTNENPYPPAPGVMEVLASMTPDSLRRYPDPRSRRLVEKFAAVLGIPPETVMAGNGSDNLIVIITRACGGPVVVPVPTFPFYQTQAEVEGGDFVEVPMGEKFTFPIDELVEKAGKVTFLASPNSPTGTSATEDQLERLASGLAGRGLLVIDEAYVDFAGGNALDLAGKYENVIILRTLSKGFSLAGLRLGFAVASPDILAGLDKAREIYNVSAVAQAAGMAALEDIEYKEANVKKVVESRESLSSTLGDAGWDVIPSDANFLFASPPGGRAADIHEKLKERNVFVRYFKHPGLEKFLRITVGTESQNEAFMAAIGEIAGR